MNSDLIEIDATSLRNLLQQQGVSQADLAKKLDISTKTIQRWLNQSIRRVKPDTVDKLSAIFGVCPTKIHRDVPVLSLRVTDRTVAEICTERVFERTRLNDTWSTYIEMLKSVNADALSSEQRYIVFRNIGISSFYLAKFQAADLYLRLAGQIASLLENSNMKIDTIIWSARRAEAFGDFKTAERLLSEAEALLTSETDLSIQSEFYYFRSRVALHKGRLEQALQDIRHSLLVSYRRRVQPMPLTISLDYVHLVHIYIRMGNYKKAQITCKKLLRSAAITGWARGLMLAHFYLGMIEYFTKGPSEVSTRHFGKAHQTRRSLAIDRYCPLVTQAEFIGLVLTERHAEARNLIAHRLQKSKKSPLYFALSAMDGALLAKVQGTKLRPSTIEKAYEFFAREEMHTAYSALKKIEDCETLDLAQVLDFHYI
ncbi:helix-turn-helix domain-containing protein [Bdellovibrio sp. HCB209]|uniref:helix-turn-helix domain-containing protein n=1 Tax=Bdellovibrio sp. HCB209 TaxID=3394354 RepID=UPI0039B619EB